MGSWELIGRNTCIGLADRREALDRLPSLMYGNLLVSERSEPFQAHPPVAKCISSNIHS